MQILTISCPTCSFSRQISSDKVPDGELRVTCPKCQTVFSYAKPAGPMDMESLPPEQPAADNRPEAAEPPPAPRNEQQVPATDAPRPRRPRPAPPRELMDIGTLFNASWKLFQQRFAILIGLYLLSILAFLVPLALMGGLAVFAVGTRSGPLLVVALLIGACASLYLGFRCFGAFLCAVIDDSLGFADALNKGGQVIFPLMWVGCLTGFIISGGFLLLIIPGIIFAVWFFFAQFIVVKEDVRGMGALLKSREYVRGRWFDVILRLLLVWAASVLLGMIPLAGPVLSIVFLPYVMIFHFLIYRDLQDMKGDIPYSCGTADLLKWPAVALAGYIVIPALLLMLIGGPALAKLRQLPLPGGSVGKVETAPTPGARDHGGYRVIDFPAKEASPPSSATQGNAPADTSPTPAPLEKGPENIHVFIYSVNYTGTVKFNSTPIKELEGKADVQYSYNLGENGLKYGANLIELDYSEVPSHQQSLLETHIRISRHIPGKGREILGEWRVSDKGSGNKSFTLDIPK